MTPIDLTGSAILLVEDDVLIKHDLAEELSAYGAKVTVAGRLVEAMELAEGEVSHAILDVKLEDGFVQPVAARLTERNIPFTFYSVAARCTGLAERFPEAQVIPKPAMPGTIAAIIDRTSRAGGPL